MSDVNLLPLPPSIRHKLLLSGHSKSADVANKNPAEIAAATNLSTHDAELAVSVGSGSSHGLLGARSAKSLYELERTTRRIITFCAPLDSILGGGVAPRQLTEICGGPGIGKSQLCMQLALDVQIPEAFGGLGGQVLYIDSEGGLTPERMGSMADALETHLKKIARVKGGAARQEAAAGVSRTRFLQGIHYCRVHSLVEQFATVDALASLLDGNPAIRLVILDSIAFHFRQETSEPSSRSRQLSQVAQTLLHLAADRGVAVVVTNHITTRPGTQGAPARLVPALGDSWAHAATSRLMLYWEDGVRRAFLYKSPSQPPASAEFLVTEEGVRGISRASQTKRLRADV